MKGRVEIRALTATHIPKLMTWRPLQRVPDRTFLAG